MALRHIRCGRQIASRHPLRAQRTDHPSPSATRRGRASPSPVEQFPDQCAACVASLRVHQPGRRKIPFDNVNCFLTIKCIILRILRIRRVIQHFSRKARSRQPSRTFDDRIAEELCRWPVDRRRRIRNAAVRPGDHSAPICPRVARRTRPRRRLQLRPQRRGAALLRAMTYATRAARLGDIVKVLQANRDAYYDVATANQGPRKRLGGRHRRRHLHYRAIRSLGHQHSAIITCWRRRPHQTGQGGPLPARHLLTPTRGVALFINAFNFPSWACGRKRPRPALRRAGHRKPATATAWLTQRMVADVVEQASFRPVRCRSSVAARPVCSTSCSPFDVLSFTGSADTAAAIRAHPAIAARSVRVNIEADSLNSALLLPDAAADSEAFSCW